MSRAFIALALLTFTSLVSCDYEVETNVGVIKGLASSDGSYFMYLGIPYALVDSSNPFGAATKYPNFDEPYEAYDHSPICPQVYLLNNTIMGSLDCLSLNIYVPSTASSINILPVMFWIYGGFFRRGYSDRSFYGPDFLVRHDVILVTFNYRLGPYGFMCLDIPEVPGNQGLKDQYMAMQWVHDNIGQFNGDVNNILLFGESAGGHSVEFHLRSQNKLLFNKIIMESGSAMAGTNSVERDVEAPIKLAAYLGNDTTDLYEALEFLATIEPKKMIEATVSLGLSFKPCVEKEFDGVSNFISTTWIDTPVPKVENMPVIIGFNRDERMFEHYTKDAAYFEKLDIFNTNLKALFNFSSDQLEDIEKLVRHFYIGDEPMSINVLWPIIRFDSDFSYIHPIQRSIKKFVESRASNVFYNMFSYSGGRNTGKVLFKVPAAGAVHGDELGYLFNMDILSDTPTTEDQLMLDRMTMMWTNFAKYSDPTPEITDLLPVKWTPVTTDKYYCMNIDSNLTVTGRPEHENMAFWDMLFKWNEAWKKV